LRSVGVSTFRFRLSFTDAFAVAAFMLTGVASTLLLPETKGLTLEDLSAEDQEHFVGDNPVTPPEVPRLSQEGAH
jgi:hypothetical protein